MDAWFSGERKVEKRVAETTEKTNVRVFGHLSCRTEGRKTSGFVGSDQTGGD